MNFLQLLEAKFFNRLPQQQVIQLASSNANFCQEWLIHAIRSACTIEELCLSLGFADKWQLPVLTQLEQYLAALSTNYSTINCDDFSAQLNKNKAIIGDYSLSRVGNILKNLHALTQTTASIALSDNVTTHSYKIPPLLIQEVITTAQPNLHDVSLYGDQGSYSEDKNIRNNTHFPTPLPNNFLALALLEKLMAASAQEPIKFAEPAVILRYQAKQYYHWHYDHIYPHNPNIEQQIQQFGQRKKTAICYLNDDFSGGETEFKQPFISVTPKQGCIVTFANCDQQGKRLPESIHRGAEIHSGEKWIITLWFRDKPFWLRNGLL